MDFTNNFKIIDASIISYRVRDLTNHFLFEINSFISLSVNPNLINNFLFYNQQFSVLHIYLLLVILYT